MMKLQEVLQTLENIGNASYDETTRFQVKEATRRLVAKLETPFERSWKLGFEDGALFAAIQTFIDRELWVKWHKAGAVKTGEDLAALDGVMSINLLRRQLRLLAAFSVIDEVDVDTFKLNSYSEALGAEDVTVRQCLQMGTDTAVDSARNLPTFLKKTNYIEPVDNVKSNFADGHGGKSLFQYCADNPGAGKSFINCMQGLSTYKLPWTNVFDTSSLFNGVQLKADKPLLCDIGGGHGVDVDRFRLKHVDEIPKKSLYLQDLPKVVDIAKVHPDIEAMAYDFFESQPLPGSRAYFTHCVLHDWPDIDCLRILKRIADACERGYSKVLLYEIVLPPKGATIMQCTLDAQIMQLVAAFERTEAAWHDICGQAGLKIVKIWSHPRAVESIIEAELA